ncbi:MAG TPA: aminoglycoside phosphotransferase family protein [Gemmataceae bacterium]|nr:aminoglycoside phosphotransferase family protein [Gemmataceae bacterium]
MIELTADNAADYLRQHGWIGEGPVRIEPLSGGVSNIVLRVETTDRLFVLKQSRPQLRTSDAWFSDVERVYREQEVMQALAPLLPPYTVPEVLFTDRPNYVFAMAHAPRGAKVWKAQLLAGDIDFAVGEYAGRILGRIHEATARDARLVEPFADRSVFVQLRVDPYYRRIQERRPEVAEAVQPLIDRLMTGREALCHGDYSPKNILTHEHGFTLVDYETAHLGDPTMDLGFCLSHLMLKAVKRSHDRQRHFELTRRFWQGYLAETTFLPGAELQRRGIEHCAVCLLARIDGTSPVEYLPEEDRREAVRQFGRRLLLERPRHWDELLDLAAELLSEPEA